MFIKKSTNSRQRGDTLIEVLVCIAVLGALIATAYTVMNRGNANVRNALDRTNTQAIINGQIAMLRSAHASDDKTAWNAIKKYVADNNTLGNGIDYTNTTAVNGSLGTPIADGCTPGVNQPGRAWFYFNTDASNPNPSQPVQYFPGGTYDSNKVKRTGNVPKAGDGLYVEGYKEYAAQGSYIFYVKSCWNTVYGSANNVDQQSKTAVRLYDGTFSAVTPGAPGGGGPVVLGTSETWSGDAGYPGCVAYPAGRLCYTSTSSVFACVPFTATYNSTQQLVPGTYTLRITYRNYGTLASENLCNPGNAPIGYPGYQMRATYLYNGTTQVVNFTMPSIPNSFLGGAGASTFSVSLPNIENIPPDGPKITLDWLNDGGGPGTDANLLIQEVGLTKQ